MQCEDHNKEIISKCMTCDVFICVKCQNSKKHDGHDRITIEELVEMKKPSIDNEINYVIIMIENECNLINGYKIVERKLYDAMEALHNELMCEEKRLQNYLDQHTKESSDRLEYRYNQLDHLIALKSKFNNSGNGRPSLIRFDKNRILNYWSMDNNNNNNDSLRSSNNSNFTIENGLKDPISQFIHTVTKETNYDNVITNNGNIGLEELFVKSLESLKEPITSPINIIYNTINNFNIQFRDYIKGLHTLEFEEESDYIIKQHRFNQILQSCDVTTDWSHKIDIKSMSIDNIGHYYKNKLTSHLTFKNLWEREMGIRRGELDKLNLLKAAAIKGNLNIFRFLISSGATVTPFIMDCASFCGQLPIVTYLDEHRTEGCTTDAMDWASRSGHLEIVTYLDEHRKGCTTDAMDRASEKGHLSIVKYLNEHRTEGCTTNAMDWAYSNGHISIVNYLNEHRTEGCTTNAMDWASKNGNFEIVKYLINHRTEGCTTDAMDWASENGHLEIVMYLNEHRKGCTTNAMDWASKNGHLSVVKYLGEHRTEGCTTDAMDLASENRHLEIIKYLDKHRTEGCTAWAMNWASMNGDLETVQYLNEHRTEGCTADAIEYAYGNKYFDIVDYLEDNGK